MVRVIWVLRIVSDVICLKGREFVEAVSKGPNLEIDDEISDDESSILKNSDKTNSKYERQVKEPKRFNY